MKKLAAIVLALSLTARTLFGNPLESTTIKETQKDYDIQASVDNKSLVLDASLPMGNNWRVNFASDMEYDDKIPIVNNVDMAIGNKNFFIGGSYGDLSRDTLLENSNIFKAQIGLKPFDWIDASVTGARVNMPNMRTRWLGDYFYETPMELYAVGWNANIGKEFNLGEVKLFPWISTTGSRYWANPAQTEDFKLISGLNPDDPIAMMSYPFDHLNVKGGLDVKTKFLDFIYQGEYEGKFYNHSPFNFTNKVGINLHDERRKSFSLDYLVSLITKPQIYSDTIIAPLRNELQFDIGGFALSDNGFFVKGNISALVNFLIPSQFNITAAIGKKFKEGNLELYYNSQSNTFGLQYSSQLDKSTEKESRLRDSFLELKSNSPSITPAYSPDINLLHSQFGNTLEEAKAKVRQGGEQSLSRLLSLIEYREHLDGTFSAKEQYEKYGWGDCEDTNGNLGVELEKAIGYREVYAVTLTGSFMNHAVIIIKDNNGKFDLRDFERYHDLNADSPDKAVEMVYPGAYIYGDGTISSSVSTVRKSVERQIYDWKRFQ